jgi:diacylglycerol kinase (ATP)
MIFNPTARGEKAKRLRRHIDDIGSQCAVKLTYAAGSARLLAAEAVREGYETVVAAGGDGTLNEVMNGIGDVPEGFARTRLAMLPLGTVNVFAKEYGLPINLRKAWEYIKVGKETVIDLPRMEYAHEGKPQVRYFAQMAGAGLDARAIEMVDWELKKKIAQMAYVVAGMKALKGPHPPIHFKSGTHSAVGELVLVGNGRFYGGKLPVFHAANSTDGLLDVCVFPRVNWFVVLRYGIGFLTGRVLPPRDFGYFQVPTMELSSPAVAPFELEGEPVGRLPGKITVVPKGLRIVVP